MAQEAEMRIRFRVQLHGGAFVDCEKLEIVEIEGEPNRIMIDGGPNSIHWEDIGGIAVIRVPVISKRNSIAPMGAVS
jgi:hypothetical protein